MPGTITTMLQDSRAATAGMQWYVVHVRSNHEFKVAERLEARDVECLLPRCTVSRQWKDRVVQLEAPLFPGYLFVHIAWRHKLQVVSQPGVVSVLGNETCFVEEALIHGLRISGEQGAAQPEDGYLCGDPVRVIAGPFAGMKALFVRNGRSSRLVITVDAIARSFSVEVDAAHVEPDLSARLRA